MRKRLIGLTLLTLVMLMTSLMTVQAESPHQPAPYNNDCFLRSSGDFARVRSDYNINAEEVTRIGKDDPVAYLVLGRNASDGYTWYLINYGWVRADVVTLEGNCANLPTLTERVDSGFNSNLFPCPTDYNAAGVTYIQPRLQMGTSVSVLETGPIFYIYDIPDAGSIPRAFAFAGDVLNIVSGPFCDDGFVFWEVTYGQLQGYAPESDYFNGIVFLTGSGGGAVPAPVESNPPQAENPAPAQQAMAGSADPAATYTTNGLPVRDLRYTNDGAHLAVSGDSTTANTDIQVWNLSTGAGVTVSAAQSLAAYGFAAAGSQLLTLDVGGVLNIWNISDGSRIEERTYVQSPLQVVGAINADGSRLAATSCADDTCVTHTINVYTVESDELIQAITLPVLAQTILFNPAGDTLVVSDGARVYLYSIGNGELLLTFAPDVLTVSRVSTLAYSVDGSQLAIGGCSASETDITLPCNQGAVQIFNRSGNFALNDLVGLVRDVAFTPNGATLAVVTDTRITLHDTATGSIQRTYSGASLNFRSAAFSPDGSLLLAGDENGTIYFWVR